MLYKEQWMKKRTVESQATMPPGQALLQLGNDVITAARDWQMPGIMLRNFIVQRGASAPSAKALQRWRRNKGEPVPEYKLSKAPEGSLRAQFEARQNAI